MSVLEQQRKTNYSWHEYASPQALAEELADHVAHHINQAVEKTGRAVIALSGGSTPKLFLRQLADRKVDWASVIVTLVDERWVDEQSSLSNAAFLKQNFLSLLETSATFIPLYSYAEDVQSSLKAISQNYCDITKSSMDLPADFDLVVLGMGQDGHTASFFPDANNIAELVSPETNAMLLACESISSQVPRVTWSLPRLCTAKKLILHVTGKSKKEVFNRACKNENALELPVRSVIFQDDSALDVYYAD